MEIKRFQWIVVIALTYFHFTVAFKKLYDEDRYGTQDHGSPKHPGAAFHGGSIAIRIDKPLGFIWDVISHAKDVLTHEYNPRGVVGKPERQKPPGGTWNKWDRYPHDDSFGKPDHKRPQTWNNKRDRYPNDDSRDKPDHQRPPTWNNKRDRYPNDDSRDKPDHQRPSVDTWDNKHVDTYEKHIHEITHIDRPKHPRPGGWDKHPHHDHKDETSNPGLQRPSTLNRPSRGDKGDNQPEKDKHAHPPGTFDGYHESDKIEEDHTKDDSKLPDWGDIGESVDSSQDGGGVIQPRLKPRVRSRRYAESKVYFVPLRFVSNGKPRLESIKHKELSRMISSL